MNKWCSVLFKCEKAENWLRKILHDFVVKSNEGECRKSGHLGLEQVISTRVYANRGFSELNDCE